MLLRLWHLVRVQMRAGSLEYLHMICQPRSRRKIERSVPATVAKVYRGALLQEVAQYVHIRPRGCEVL